MKQELLYPLAVWFVLISLITAAVTAADKVRAKKGAFRISEKTLILLALSGGSLAEYLTMRLIRHKTLHKKFTVGLPLIMIAQLIAVSLLLVRLFS
ncbi:MAG: DUF1294 domain-containing protein [Clostridia bacterium]|nr:DUF1294 domain-containing protein [Oscillospiraceae bacterium]MBQ7005730.1 DUF1294 domain-containing protein [Clostridia bacterium]